MAYTVENVARRLSLSLEIGLSMCDYIFEAFERELLLQSVIKRVQPYAFDYALGAAYKLAMHDVQTADPRADDEYVREESEPVRGADSVCLEVPRVRFDDAWLRWPEHKDSGVPPLSGQEPRCQVSQGLGIA